MVSRNFLIQQATLNAAAEYFPTAVGLQGPVPALRALAGFIDRESHWFLTAVRRNFLTLDRRAREQQDVIRFEDWRAITGNFK